MYNQLFKRIVTMIQVSIVAACMSPLTQTSQSLILLTRN